MNGGDSFSRCGNRRKHAARAALHAGCWVVGSVAALSAPISRADTSFDISSGSFRTEAGSYTIGDGVDATVRVNGGRWDVPSDLTVGDHGGNGVLEITNDGEVAVYRSLRLNPNGAITLNGGTLRAGNFESAGGTFNWISGNLSCWGEMTQDMTTVNANSRLQLSGNLTGNVRVRSGGTFEGDYGTVHGNVVNNGDVDLYVSSLLKINGNYTQNVGSTLTTHMNGQDVLTYEPGKISVTGTATINGGIVRPVARDGIYLPGYQYPILHADQGITGEFDGIIQPAIVKCDITYDANNAYLVVTGHSFYVLQVVTENQRSLGTLLYSSTEFGPWEQGSWGRLFVGWLQFLPQPELQQLLEELNPAIFDAFTSVSFESTAAYLSATSRGFRHPGASVSATSSTAPMAFDDLSLQATSGQPLHLSTNPPAAPASDPSLALWASGISHWSGQDNSPQARGDDVFTSGVAVGGDYRISPSTSVGLSLGYTHSDIDWQEDAATGNGQTGYGSLYGNWADNGFWADAILGMGLSWYDATRNIPTFGRSADSDFTAQEYFARLDGGYDWKVGRWTAGPIGSLQYINSQQGSFSETGADSLDLSVGDRDASSLQSGLGLRAGYMIDVGTTRLTPSVRAQWVHEYFNDERAIDASLAGAGDAEFRVHGNAPTRDSALLGVGLDASVTQRVALYLDFESLLPLDGEQLTTYSLVGGLRWQF